MQKINITFEEFETYINKLKAIDDLQNEISNVVAVYNSEWKDSMDYAIFPSLTCEVISLLSKLTHDENEWIDYFIFELDYGSKYEDGFIKDADGNNIKLQTIKDLWELLLEENGGE